VTSSPTNAELEQRIAELEAELEERVGDLKRVAADFDNYRKRAARDQESLVARAHERLVKELLPVLDDLERALDAAAEHNACNAGEPSSPARTQRQGEAKLEDGVRLVHRELSQVLSKEGLVAIETDGKFDPHEHEALLTQPSEVEEGSILQVIQKGYRLGDRVVRPARVVVAASRELAAGGDED
jgi:molecular chaperone GrpE